MLLWQRDDCCCRVCGASGRRKRFIVVHPRQAITRQSAPVGERTDLGTEGAVLFKANGRYYLGAAEEYEGRYSTCLAVSDNL